ncbi:hypothetical protein BBBOND_0201190 [Babesia bigemina]|uniref:Uncharacterized protein n=1 Tax=Babesia bigemina TaxID=5866 RepID=A0A061D4I6_BABBI|nr:hypothetical protein BBBOND_0201190 [Babesia bigemina]CDR94962.1 hypothetical protein BBBOND_0201190 [Babesia bigemina]|eukprot:XP_012767148.1 hypothetical protein BBBOND_0201190 [Babesia bigemina]
MAPFRSLARLSNIAKVSQYVDKVADLGRKNLLFRVDFKHLYSIWQLCKSHEEYKLGLIAVNHFYNFGRQLSPEGVNKLFVFSMRCGELEESLKLLEGARDWLPKPPDIDLVYGLMASFVTKRDYLSVKRVFKAIRSNWQMRLTAKAYRLCIEAMLCSDENPLEEALMVYCDSAVMGIALPSEVHALLLNCLHRKIALEPAKAAFYETSALSVRNRLGEECMNEGGYKISRATSPKITLRA